MNGLAYYQLLKYIPILYEYILLLLGCERFSDYGGYGDTFFWKGRHDDKSIRWDELIIIQSIIINYYVEFTFHFDSYYFPNNLEIENIT